MRGVAAAALLALSLLHTAVTPAAAAAPVDIRKAPWEQGPQCPDPAASDGVLASACRHMRILLNVTVPEALEDAANLPVTSTVDLAAALGGLGDYPTFSNGQLMGFELDLGSLLLVEVQAGSWAPVHKDGAGHAVPEAMLAFPGDIRSGDPFDARTNPVVTVQWVLAGPTSATRYFFLYFDSLTQGKKQPVSYDAAQLGRVAAAVGPGRGNAFYVALHGDLGIPSSSDPRFLRVTNLQDDAQVTVEVYEYERFNVPRGQPRPELTRTLDPGVGKTVTIQLPSDYGLDAVKVVASGGLVLVEAVSRVGSSAYQPGSGRLFLPSADGGYVGTRFAGQSPVAANWLVFCPALAENVNPCKVTGSAGSADIAVGSSFAALPVPAGAAASLQATTGVVLVERVPTNPGLARDQYGMTLWPPADGPVTSSLFLGHSSSGSGMQDKLALVPFTDGSRLQVFSLQARAFLADRLDPQGPGLFHESVGGAWGTVWARDWTIEATQQHVSHETGPARIRDTNARGLNVLGGAVGDDATFSAYVPALSPDGGLTYRVTLPADASGTPLGRIALFSPYPGTNVRIDPLADTGTAGGAAFNSLQQDDYLDAAVDKPGTWTVTANHPVLLTWVKVGTEAMAGFAPGLTTGIAAHADAAQFAGYAFRVEGELFKVVRPGDIATFTLHVHNLARKANGDALEDSALLSAAAPAAWPDAVADPGTLVLPAGGSREVAVRSQVPVGVPLAQGGATVKLTAASSGQPGFRVDLPLRVNFKVEHVVDVAVVGSKEQSIRPDETAAYEVVVTNLGSVPDQFRLVYTLPQPPWSIAVGCPDVDVCFDQGDSLTPTLAPNEGLSYFLEVKGAEGASKLTTSFFATSVADSAAQGGVDLTTLLSVERKLSVIAEETSRIVLPGEAGNFTITFKNDGLKDEEVRLGLNVSGPASWTRPSILVDDPDLDHPVPLGALNNTFGVRHSQQVRLLVNQQVPQGAPPGQIRVMRLTVATGGDASQGGERSEHQLRVISGRSSGLNLTGLPAALDVLPGTSVELPITLRSTSNAPQVVRLQGGVQPAPREWNVTLDGRPGPWTLNLTVGGNATARLKVTASPHAPATSFVASTLLLQASVPGASILAAKVKLRVPDARDLAVLDSSLRLEAGRTQEVLLHLRNRGNVPVQAVGALTDLDWGARWQNATLGPGEDGTLHVWLDVPTTAGSRSATLRVTDRLTGAVLATQALTLDVRVPQLEIQVTGARSLANGLRSYTLSVANHAPSAARMVQLQLMQGPRVLDAAVLESILPGATGTAHLVAAAHDGLSLRIRSADDPAGRTIALEGLPTPDGAATARPAPAPAPIVLLALLAIAVALRRRTP